MRRLSMFSVKRQAQTLVEYALLISLIGIVVMAILAALGAKSRDVYVQMNTQIASTADRNVGQSKGLGLQQGTGIGNDDP